MKVAKKFQWEGAHRLPWHEGLCSNLHGHSYRMVVEVEGSLDEHGMVIDFTDIKRIITLLTKQWDHATLVHEEDTELLDVLLRAGWKHFVLPYDSTAENVARFAADFFCAEAADALRSRGLSTVRVTVHETETCYAVYTRAVETSPLAA
ncbi:MAG: 6-carboxytetrahydropterin synthase [Deltaproteobacteria bacterium]|nr:6-carboxytetrahydropterin synthase [Deltaproteobacteria bacterium]